MIFYESIWIDLNQYHIFIVFINVFRLVAKHWPRSAFSGGRRWKSVVWECLETRRRVCQFAEVWKTSCLSSPQKKSLDPNFSFNDRPDGSLPQETQDKLYRSQTAQSDRSNVGKLRPRVFWVCLWCKENPTVWIARWKWPESSSKRIHGDTWPNCTGIPLASIRLRRCWSQSRLLTFQSDFVGVTGAEICLKSESQIHQKFTQNPYQKISLKTPWFSFLDSQLSAVLGLRPWCGLDFQEKNVAQTSEPEK